MLCHTICMRASELRSPLLVQTLEKPVTHWMVRVSSTGQTYGARMDAGMYSRAAVDFLRDYTAGTSHEQRLVQVKWLASMMDDNFRVPGTNLRFGWDSVLGLFPGLGDVLSGAISLLIVHHAWQTKASPLTLARMMGNVGADFAVGAIPFVGDLFDFVFKANRKNARLLERHLTRQAEKQRAARPCLPRN
jgi:uncharacterized protein DUF4112